MGVEPRAGRRGPSLLTLAHRWVRDHALVGAGDLVLCACSGGPDSMALLHVLGLLRRRIGHRLCAVGIDHGLRAEAAGELALAERLAAKLGVDWESVRVRVGAGSNLQARARVARHEALQRAAAASKAAVIALGHTADDRAETVLIRLLRGAGPRGLAVLGPRSSSPTPAVGAEVDLVRPLIGARRSDVLTHLRRHGIDHARDPSNEDARFLRVRVRRELLPLLEQLSPRIVEHLCCLATMLESAQGPQGEVRRLGRAQRMAIERAIRLGRSRTTVREQGGRDVEWLLPRRGSGELPTPSRVRRGER